MYIYIWYIIYIHNYDYCIHKYVYIYILHAEDCNGITFCFCRCEDNALSALNEMPQWSTCMKIGGWLCLEDKRVLTYVDHGNYHGTYGNPFFTGLRGPFYTWSVGKVLSVKLVRCLWTIRSWGTKIPRTHLMKISDGFEGCFWLVEITC